MGLGPLDAIINNPIASLVPGMDELKLVSKGLDLLKGLFDKGDMKGSQKLLDFLSDVLSKQGGQNGAPSLGTEPQPFTPPPAQTPQTQGQPRNGERIEIKLTLGGAGQAPAAQPLSHGLLPGVDGSAQGDQAISNAARPNVEGSEANKNRALTPGSNEWTTVMWAMQQNPNVNYNADTQRFTMKMSDGSSRDVCSLQDAEKNISANGGFNRNNPTAASTLGSFLNDKVEQARQSPNSSSAAASGGQPPDPASIADISKKMDELKAQLKKYEDARNMMDQAQQNSTRLSGPDSLDVQVDVRTA